MALVRSVRCCETEIPDLADISPHEIGAFFHVVVFARSDRTHACSVTSITILILAGIVSLCLAEKALFGGWPKS